MFNRILFAAGAEGETSEFTLAYVRELAQAMNAEVIVVGVGEVSEEQIGIAKKVDVDAESKARQLETARKVGQYQSVSAVAGNLIEHGIKAIAESRTGRVADEILNAADEFDAGLIVVGASQRNPLLALLTGSVPNEIVRKCTRPVLFIPLPDAGK